MDDRLAPPPSGLRGFVLAGARSGRLPALVVLLGGLILVYGFLFSSDFAVGTVVVRGASLASPEDVAAASDALGGSVFDVDAEAIARRVAALPAVERATARAELPDRVVIEIEERQPALVWQADDAARLVDARGNVLADAGASDLPRLTVDRVAPPPGARTPVEVVTAALALDTALTGDLRQLRWTSADGFAATLNDQRVVVFGDAASVPLKLAAYQAALKLDADWTLLDVSSPDRPYYK